MIKQKRYLKVLEQKYLNQNNYLICEHGKYIIGSEETSLHYLFFHNTLLPQCSTLQSKKESKIGLLKFKQGQPIRTLRRNNKTKISFLKFTLFQTNFRSRNYNYSGNSKIGKYLNKYH